jgi:hypothetical protein
MKRIIKNFRILTSEVGIYIHPKKCRHSNNQVESQTKHHITHKGLTIIFPNKQTQNAIFGKNENT